MAYDHRFKSYCYVQKITDHCTLPNTSTYGEINKFYFSDATGIIGINSDGTQHARIFDEFQYLTPGDVIEISADVRNISGAKVKVAFGEYNASGDKMYLHTYESEKTGEWETVTFSYIFRNLNVSRKAHFYIGLVNGESGQFDMRYLNVAIQTKRKYERPFGLKPYMINKVSGVFGIRGDFANGGGTLTTLDSTTLRLTFQTPFRNRPTPHPGGDYSGSSYLYTVKTTNPINTSVDIRLYDSTNNPVPLADIPDGIQFSLLLVSWEIM